MNLAICRIEANLGPHHADTFHHDLHPDLRADYILANPLQHQRLGRSAPPRRPPLAVRRPPVNNANYAWIQHIAAHLAPNGVAGFVLANGSLSSNTSGEGEIRKRLVEADLVDCIVALPGQLFYSTQIPVSLWFLGRNKLNGRGMDNKPLRDRAGETLFIDARQLGRMEDRIHRVLDPADIARIAATYHAWRGDGAAYADTPASAKPPPLADIRAHNHTLTPGRYVGVAPTEESTEPFAATMPRLIATLDSQFTESAKLETVIRANLAAIVTCPRKLGHG